MADYDVIVVGAGHNALVAAAYVAQAGYRVGVFERRQTVGGAVGTNVFAPGYRFDIGGSAHILIRLTSIPQELRLDQYGLEYLELDPLFYAPFEDESSFFIYRDLSRTIEHLEQRFPGEGESYERFINDWLPFAQSMREAFLSMPSPFELGRTMVMSNAATMDWQHALSTIVKPYGEVLDGYFKEEKIKAALTWMAAQSGPPPTEPLTAPFLLWHPLYHEGGIARPRGGSGMLSVALQRHIEAHGGAIHLSAPVEEILIEQGAAIGIRTHGGIYTARAVLAGTHVKESLGRLLPAQHRHPAVARARTGNGFGAILRLALSSPVDYSADPGAEARTGLQLLCRDRQQIKDAYADFLTGRPAEDPPLVAMTFSAVDDTLAPPGGAVLWLWGQYFPYSLRDGARWDDLSSDIADRFLDTYERYAPGTRERVVGALFQHPEWLEQELGLLHGNVMHLEMSLDQMFALRPAPGLAQYRTHLKRLFITGASTHPGGGIMGISGRNASRVVLKSLTSVGSA